MPALSLSFTIHLAKLSFLLLPAPAPLNTIAKLNQIWKIRDVVESMVSTTDVVASMVSSTDVLDSLPTTHKKRRLFAMVHPSKHIEARRLFTMVRPLEATP